ncbi:MAG TPA: hypothetical protein VGC91_13510 [Pyrinomonadaceae bacterium]|jgi:hypothetical protein
MKKCPSCNRTYTDDALSFCLEDGSPLLSIGGSSSDQSPSFDPNATLQYNPARDTSPPPTQIYNPSQSPSQPYTPMPTPSWSPTPGALPPQKKSKAIYWILGGVGALVIVGIIGVVALVVIVGMNSNANNSNAKNSNRNSNVSNSNNSNANTTASNKNSGTSSDKSYQLQDDFSNANWWSGTNSFGSAEYVNGEYQLSAGSYQGYVVVYGPKKDEYYTQNATSRVTVHSVTGTSPSLGYGLTVYGELKNDVLEDYGFLIRTDESPAFRVVLHQGGKESVLVNWTRSSLIRTGSSPNQLEVRASDEQLSFYINGQFATSVTDKANYKRGLVGFYSSDTEAVAFDDLEIVKQ